MTWGNALIISPNFTPPSFSFLLVTHSLLSPAPAPRLAEKLEVLLQLGGVASLADCREDDGDGREGAVAHEQALQPLRHAGLVQPHIGQEDRSASIALDLALVSLLPPKKLMLPKYALVVLLDSAGGKPRAITWNTLSSYQPSASTKQYIQEE